MKTNNINFKGLHPFELQIKYLNIDDQNPGNVHTSHIHDKCEIYINLSGDVSFIVENNIFDRSINTLISCSALEEKHLPVMKNNTYIQYKDGLYGLCGVPYDHYEKFDDGIEDYIMNSLGEKDAVIAVVPEDDGLCCVTPNPEQYYPTPEGYSL